MTTFLAGRADNLADLLSMYQVLQTKVAIHTQRLKIVFLLIVDLENVLLQMHLSSLIIDVPYT